MAYPTFAELKKYVGKALTNTDWDFNFQRIVTWLTGGTIDLNVGDIISSGNITATSDIYTTAFTDYSALSTIVGWTTYTEKKIFYKRIGNIVLVSFSINGTSNTTGATFTLPLSTVGSVVAGIPIMAKDNSSQISTACIAMSSTTVTAYATLSGVAASWTASNTKSIYGQFWYETL